MLNKLKNWYHNNKTKLFSEKPWTTTSAVLTIGSLAVFVGFLLGCLISYTFIPKALINSGYIVDGEKGYVLVEDKDWFEIRQYKQHEKELQYYKNLAASLKNLLDQQNMYEDYNNRQQYRPDVELQQLPDRNYRQEF